MTARTPDTNGWFEVKRNPLSKVGVFPYLGRQLGAGTDRFPTGDPDKIYSVLRPAEELADPECLDSFRLLPIVDDHTMLGDEALPGRVAAEKKGVHGMTGDRVEFDAASGTLYANIKIISGALKKRIDNGKRELSCGYGCVYDFTPGMFQGKAYDAIQRRLRGNHVALVNRGRMGPEVAVLDQMTFTVDGQDLEPMRKSLFTTAAIAALEAAKAAGASDAVIAACDASVKECEKADQAVDDDGLTDDAKVKIKTAEDGKAAAEAAVKTANDALDAATTELAKLKKPEPKPGDTPAADAAVAELRTALDAANVTITELKAKIDAAPVAMDEAAIFKTVAARDALAARLKVHVGVFDHADKTLAEVAAYGIDKLGLKNIEKGHELTALDAYLQAKPVSEPVAQGANDGAVTPAAGSKVAGFIAGTDKK